MERQQAAASLEFHPFVVYLADQRQGEDRRIEFDQHANAVGKNDHPGQIHGSILSTSRPHRPAVHIGLRNQPVVLEAGQLPYVEPVEGEPAGQQRTDNTYRGAGGMPDARLRFQRVFENFEGF